MKGETFAIKEGMNLRPPRGCMHTASEFLQQLINTNLKYYATFDLSGL